MIRNYEVQEIGEYSRLVGEENLRIVLDTFDGVKYDQMIRVLAPVADIQSQIVETEMKGESP